MNNKIINIQYARAFAAICIVLYHVMRKGMLLGYNEFEFEIGKMSVPLFFIISGFIMCYIQDVRPKHPLDFFKNRIIRILPPYYFFTTLILVIYIIKPDLVKYSHYPNISIIGSYTLWPMINSSMLLNPGWTLRPEFTFYFVFFITTLFFKKSNQKYLFVMLVCFSLSIVSYFSSIEVFRAFFNYMYIFAIGMVVYNLRGKLYGDINTVLFVVFSCLTIFLITKKDDVDVISSLLLGGSFLFFLNMEGKINHGRFYMRWLGLIGDASYSIYLTHVLNIGVSTYIFKLSGINSSVLYVSFTMLLSLIVGLFTYKYIEVPLIKITRRFFS